MTEPAADVGVPFDDEQLADFFVELRARGYSIRPEQLVAVGLLLARLADRGALPADPAALARYLGPLVCSTRRQQGAFPTLFAGWIETLGASREPPSPNPSPSLTLDYETLVRLRRARIRRALVLGLATVLLAALAGLVLRLLGPLNLAPEVVAAPPAILRPIVASPWVLALGGLLASLAMAVLLLRLRPWFLARREQQTPSMADSFAISAPTDEDWLPAIARDVAVRMRQRETHESDDLDLAATVHASCLQAGRFEPVYAVRSRIPDYLVLVEATGRDDLRAVRAAGIVDKLRHDRAYVDLYYFDGDPRMASTGIGEGKTVTLAELANRHPAHRLVVCSEGEGMVSAATGLPHRWMTLFERWDHRSLLTLVPVADWGNHERALSSRGFRLLPSTPDGFGAVADPRLAQRLLSEGRAAMPPRYPDLLRENEEAWLAPNRPEPKLVAAGVQQVRDYLGEVGYQWLTASAVYPEIRAELTLHVGGRIARPFQASILERLARLPWMRHAFLPDWLRETLLDSLRGRSEQRLRGELRGLLHPQLRAALRFTFAYSWLGRVLRLGKVASSAADDPLLAEALRDRVFVTWIDNRLAFRLPRVLARWLRHPHWRRSSTTSSDSLTPDTAHYYEPQYAVPLRGWVALLVGVVTAAVSGLLYGVLLGWAGGWVLGLIGLAIFCGGSMAMFVLAAAVIHGGHVRGPWFGALTGVVLSTVFLLAKLEYTLDFALDPRRLGELLSTIAAAPDSGWWTYTRWSLEVFLMALVAIPFGYGVAEEPYCTRCRDWTSEKKRVYGPLQDEAMAVRDLLMGRYWHLFGLGRVAADKRVATVVVLEHCQPECSATTLLTISRRSSSRTGEELTGSTETPLIRRLFAPRRVADEVRHWLTATTSIRPNLVSEWEPLLYGIVSAALPYVDEVKATFYVYGDIPSAVLKEARKMAEIPDDEKVAAVAVNDFRFIFRYYSVFALTESGVYAYHTKRQFTPYAEMRSLVSKPDNEALKALESLQIAVEPMSALLILRAVLAAPGVAQPQRFSPPGGALGSR